MNQDFFPSLISRPGPVKPKTAWPPKDCKKHSLDSPQKGQALREKERARRTCKKRKTFNGGMVFSLPLSGQVSAVIISHDDLTLAPALHTHPADPINKGDMARKKGLLF
ncbi:hypothetical protein KY314_03100 [Candidatus Woesearchaeota archaeon]|nr:hypothetical protein [Candidatus Woesearchaeota archaeon]